MNINKYSLITKKYSNTFYYSTLIFPKEVRDKVFVLYSFVRTIDNLMDSKKPDIAKFNDLRSSFEKAWKGEPVNNKLVVDFVSVAKSNNFSKKWIDDFFDAQILSAKKKTYNDFDDLKKNIYGVAGVIGLFMSKIIGLPKKVYKNAVLLGESMQIINCMRDIVEDYKMGRIYIPVEDLEKFGLSVDNFLNKKNRNKLKEVINFQLQRAFKFGEKASLSFSYFDKRNLLAVKTSFDLYCFIGKKILKDPEIIFQRKKIKPGLLFILLTFFKNFFNIYFLGRK